MYNEINNCRICGNEDLSDILKLGEQHLTGVFPRSTNENITKGPLDLVFCSSCGLLQLKHSFSLDEMYGENYGYRSSLNKSMVDHLEAKVLNLEKISNLSQGDLVLDIGSNDGTTLQSYNIEGIRRIGIDPTGIKFAKYYTKDIDLVTDFFPSKSYSDLVESEKAKIITSIAMFYDLEDPKYFVNNIVNNLHKDGIWHFEQSYMPLMIEMNAYDTICHEHLEFYSFTVVNNLLQKCGLKVIDVEINNINGGSFAVTACLKDSSKYTINNNAINKIIKKEEKINIRGINTYKDFSKNIINHKRELLSLLDSLIEKGKKVIGYGASTKGNVMIQYCGITSKQIPFIAEVNKDKFGCFTPGSNIPIISESEAMEMKPDYLLVFPWHFKNNILQREKVFLQNGGKIIFPLPDIEIV